MPFPRHVECDTMDILGRLFGDGKTPSERQLKKAVKQVTQTHGDAAPRVAAMERLAAWGTPGAAKALLRRFTIQVAQATMDSEEKQYTVTLISGVGQAAVAPILGYLRTEGEVTWPIRALREILPAEEFHKALRDVLEDLAEGYTRWPQAKAVMIEHLPDEAFPLASETVLKLLQDDDDDVCIAAIDFIARNADEELRRGLLQTFLDAEARPRVQGYVLGVFCEQQWPVKGFRKKIEESIIEPFYLTSKGTVKRRAR